MKFSKVRLAKQLLYSQGLWKKNLQKLSFALDMLADETDMCVFQAFLLKIKLNWWHGKCQPWFHHTHSSFCYCLGSIADAEESHISSINKKVSRFLPKVPISSVDPLLVRDEILTFLCLLRALCPLCWNFDPSQKYQYFTYKFNIFMAETSNWELCTKWQLGGMMIFSDADPAVSM